MWGIEVRVFERLEVLQWMYSKMDQSHTGRVTFHKNIPSHYKPNTASPRPSISIRSAPSYEMDRAPAQSFEIDDILEISYSDRARHRFRKGARRIEGSPSAWST